MALKMANASKEAMARHADKTAEIIFLEGGPGGKIEKEIAAADASKVKRKFKSELCSAQDQLEAAKVESSRFQALFNQEKSKRLKLEAKLKNSPPSTLPKEAGGPATGAKKNNQSGKSQKQNPPSRKSRANKPRSKAEDANNDADEETKKHGKNRNRNYWRRKKGSSEPKNNQN
jgi:hypothetical protein